MVAVLFASLDPTQELLSLMLPVFCPGEEVHFDISQVDEELYEVINSFSNWFLFLF